MENEYFLVEPENLSEEEMEELNKTSVFVNFMYFHGKLEKDLKYDLVRVKGINLLNELFKTIYCKTNKFNAKVLVNNELKDCVVFCWLSENNNIFRGLIVYENDTKEYEYAKEQYTKRVDTL